MLIQNSEKDGVHGLRPHAALEQGDFITIKFNNSFNRSEGYRPQFEIQCYNNTTLFELKKLVVFQLAIRANTDGTWAYDTPPHPAQLKLSRHSQAKFIQDMHNGSTLGELKFKTNE